MVVTDHLPSASCAQLHTLPGGPFVPAGPRAWRWLPSQDPPHDMVRILSNANLVALRTHRHEHQYRWSLLGLSAWHAPDPRRLAIALTALTLLHAGSFKQRLLLKLGAIVAEHGASLAYPVCLNAQSDYNPLLLGGALNGNGRESPQGLLEPQHAA